MRGKRKHRMFDRRGNRVLPPSAKLIRDLVTELAFNVILRGVNLALHQRIIIGPEVTRERQFSFNSHSETSGISSKNSN
jgi:hypothetical protein